MTYSSATGALFPAQNLRILIADDHALVRGGLALVVAMAAPDCKVFEANSYNQVIEVLSTQADIDLIMLDLNMPGMDVNTSLTSIRRQWPDVPIIVVSVRDDIDSIRTAMATGVSGYIPKSLPPNVTLSAIKLILEGGIYVPPHVLNFIDDVAAPAQNLQPNPTVDLTRRQQDVLKLMQSGLSNQAIADQLGLTLPTIKMHVSALFKKLQVKNRTEAVAFYGKAQED
ncbi:response regulator transcription factor [Candidatus Njordibacter sp. Uisw_039]|jgi:DNA-binding NarL/FixJ family response regulator|uniref:response regulator n=1 Tax=Candidatus Njordibacter sp. Uisw_039 TaxID=3230972 RepID=UPI003D46AADF|tara:strand:- start:1185 stop:1865 length:681 start_codon:yes stop_codon:yes gene_type:complete